MSEYLNEMIGYDVSGTAEWRRRKAAEFPDDARNIRAAEELERLAKDIDALADGSEIEKQISSAQDNLDNVTDGDAWVEITETVSEELRSIGFHEPADTAINFLNWYRDLLIERLHELIEEAVPSPNLDEQIENDPAVKAAKQAYDEARAKALIEARKRL